MKEHRNIPVVCLMGPTGAGKTSCAIRLASRLPLEIISVDSALVYKGLDIGTAKPDPSLRRRVPHHLIDICDPAEAFSAAEFRARAGNLIAEIAGRGRIPLLVGGTGLYFRTLLEGISPLPPADPGVRARLQASCTEFGSAALHKRLEEVDPFSAKRIHPNDPQRILRALEVFELTGTPLTAWWAAQAREALNLPIVKWVIAPSERSRLHQQLASRFAAMLERGLVNEVLGLRGRPDLDLTKPALRAVGYRSVWRFLAGELGYAEMVTQAVTATRQLAKRQLTWFRAETHAQWLDSEQTDLIDVLTRGLEAHPLMRNVDYT
ncbi:MAG: tRNA (adenosine(37)-N6)-dimethylallyltransferase MiaA [Gammaproteobacteria bacterium]|nr:tRNA (adenosine(37)-N6)-dimethylallyltransferase MiaA [Gammaproteobacteria bacterium]